MRMGHVPLYVFESGKTVLLRQKLGFYFRTEDNSNGGFRAGSR